MKSSEPYGVLAQIYDRVMVHVDYGEWARYMDAVFRRYAPVPSSVIELACGTGTLAGYLARYGYRVTGIDRSPAMLMEAAEKLADRGQPLLLAAADFTELPFRAGFDAAVCLYDSMNYLMDPDAFRLALEEIASVVRENGLFVFDVCTVKNSQLFFSNHSMSDDLGDISYHRTSRYDSRDSIQENAFVIHVAGRRFHETHRQRIYRLAEIDDMLLGSPFALLGRYDEMSFAPGTEESERVHYVLRRL